jgi:hypothetical protein
MQKQIFFVCTVFCTTIIAMEKLVPRIIYHKNNVSDSLIKQLSEKFGSINIVTQQKDLDNTCTTIHATQCITPHDNQKRKLNYVISLSEGHSFQGSDTTEGINIYAPIPMAAAYALETKLVERILIIDENITPKTADYYFDHGNGSILFPKNSPELKALFNKKIIAHTQTSKELWDFLHDQKNKIDLAFYNMNIDDVEPIENMDPADAKERKLKIISLLYHFIPTIFIFSGDKEKYQTSLCDHIDYINDQAQKSVAFKNEPFPRTFPMPHLEATMSSSRSSSIPLNEFKQKWAQCKDNFIHAARDLMSCAEEHPVSISLTEISSFPSESLSSPRF